MTDLRSDLQADLQADLFPDLARTAQPSARVVEPEPSPAERTDSTPALSMQWTPLRWSRPRVVKAKGGAGKALKVGPLKLELSVKE